MTTSILKIKFLRRPAFSSNRGNALITSGHSDMLHLQSLRSFTKANSNNGTCGISEMVLRTDTDIPQKAVWLCLV